MKLGGWYHTADFPDLRRDTLGLSLADPTGNGIPETHRGDVALFTGVAQPIRDYETVLELTYQLNVAPWWVLQPDLQLIFHPGGDAVAPLPAPVDQPIPNALVRQQATELFRQGRYAGAEPLLKRNLAIHEKALGPEHPDVSPEPQ